MVKLASTPRLSAQERQQRLEQSAVALFAKRGFLATTIEDIVRDAGVTKPVFYRHYESKQEIMLRLLSRHRDGLAMGPLIVLTQTETEPLAQRITRMLTAWFGYLDANPFALQLLHSRSGDPEIDTALDQLHNHQRAADANLLRQFARTPIPETELDALGEAIRATLSALALRTADGTISRQAAINAIVRIVLGLLDP